MFNSSGLIMKSYILGEGQGGFKVENTGFPICRFMVESKQILANDGQHLPFVQEMVEPTVVAEH